MYRIYPHRKNDIKRAFILDKGPGTRKRYFPNLTLIGIWEMKYDYSKERPETWCWLESPFILHRRIIDIHLINGLTQDPKTLKRLSKVLDKVKERTKNELDSLSSKEQSRIN